MAGNDAITAAGFALTIDGAAVARAAEGAKSGGDVAIAELVLAHEGFG